MPKEENVDNKEKLEKDLSEEKNSEFKSETSTKKTKVEESSIVEKIKNFLSKIAAIQEENRKAQEENKVSTEKDEVEEDDDDESESVKEVVEKPKYMTEYYDLPYRYNETVVKILVQTPKKLFVYWDVADNDKSKYQEAFGNDFFTRTYPVLLLYNNDKQYVKEITINDFANSWYIDIDDPKTKYTIQLGRKFYSAPKIVNYSSFQENKIILQNDYLPLANSNVMEVPNDHILLDELPEYLKFRNVKNNHEFERRVRDFKDAYGNSYDVEKFYEDEYDGEMVNGKFDMKNPSSNVNSSVFK